MDLVSCHSSGCIWMCDLRTIFHWLSMSALYFRETSAIVTPTLKDIHQLRSNPNERQNQIWAYQ